MGFKSWLEIAMGAEGADQNPTQTARASTQAANHVLSQPSAGQFRADFTRLQGSPSVQRKAFFNHANQAIGQLPPDIKNRTTPDGVMYQMQKSMGINPQFVKQPTFMRKK